MSARAWGPVLVVALALGPAVPSRAQESGTGNPHGPLPEGLDCSACHTPGGWTPLRAPPAFDHGATAFPLEGRHGDVACGSCHLDLRFDGPRLAPDDCGSCHLDVHQGTLLEACASCHTTSSFLDVEGREVHVRTAFPLTGAHLQVTCESCHADERGGAFTGLDTECASCHLGDYERAATVDHVAGGYPTECTECHSTVAWSDAPSFDHVSASGGYGLVGAHALLRCGSCHELPGLAPIFRPAGQDDCVACHQADYDEEHAGSGFPVTCLDCHDQISWEDAEFDHDAGGFALLGRHRRLDCEACHTNSGGGLRFPAPAGQDDCVACHRVDYDDEHAGSGFPTTCLTCHTVETWDAAELDHDARFFPIYSGAHEGEWGDCAACHTVPSDFSVFTCVNCHARAETDDDHDEVAGYVYESTQCHGCHTDGES